MVASKVVSISEKRYVDLATVTPSPRAREISAQTGNDLAAALTAEESPLRLLDIRPHHQVPASAQAQRVDLRDLTATIEATAGGSVLIHLAGITEEAAFPEICEHNILGAYHVLEAAHRNHIRRVVLASNHHTTTGVRRRGEDPGW